MKNNAERIHRSPKITLSEHLYASFIGTAKFWETLEIEFKKDKEGEDFLTE